MSRKGAKSQHRVRGLRSTGTKARTHVERLRAANADLKKKLDEALEQQTATSDVLRVISGSPNALEPVFQAMLANATRICDANLRADISTRGRCVSKSFRCTAHPRPLLTSGGATRCSIPAPERRSDARPRLIPILTMIDRRSPNRGERWT